MKKERLIRKPKLLDRIGLSNSTLYYFIKEGSFPQPVKLGKRTVAWRESEVDEWISSREYTINKTDES